jgi:acetyl esterase/lipase
VYGKTARFKPMEPRQRILLTMFRFRFLAAACVLATLACPLSRAQDIPPKGYASVEILWQGGAPGAVGKEDADVPRLYCYPAAGDGPHAAVVVLPGGGYNHLVFEKEGAVEARWLNERGVSAYVLQYRLSPRYHYPSPMLDGERAVRLVRAKAKEWHLRPDAIGVWGFSAGGHLAGYLATLQGDGNAQAEDPIERVSSHPDFAILSYARLSLDPNIPGTFGMETLTGKDAPQSVIDAISPVLHVSKHTSPSFLYATELDEKVNSINATAFYEALRRAGVPAELHVFEQGPHGTGMGQNLPKTPELAVWPLLLEHWMQAHHWIELTANS